MKNELTAEQISTLVKFSAHEDSFINEVGYDVFGRKLNVGDLVYAVSTQSGGRLSRRVGYVGDSRKRKYLCMFIPECGRDAGLCHLMVGT